ncbi:glycosyltransferase family 4 protein [Novosphingobium sp. 9U]|uniref:glycosyltransferase family 4 protein n=1 Tax=Novosphingobium sp. 9U TaxID=2653158 RepID=UPI0012F2E8D3|nr:glycosyltransferase family 4 protein [Novosphingobium sp. 9U]VWX53328.1 Glycosyltransferase family 1 protein [Novosphingobium sp. 9U]
MRILQVHKDFEPLKGGGGTARHIHGLARALTGSGHEVKVASLHPEIVETPYKSFHASATQLRSHIAWADVIHVHGARSKYAVAGALHAKLQGKPFVYTPHAFYGAHSSANAAFKAVWDRTAEKFLFEKGAGTVLLTDAWYGWLKDRGISAKRTIIIPNCVLGGDLAAPPSRPGPGTLAGAPAIITIGRLDPVKRVGDVIRALGRPELVNAHFHIVGRGDQREELEALAQSTGVKDRVTFHGFVDDAGVAAMVADSDVFVLASEQEGLPTVLLEMLIARVPIVCTRIPGNLAITSVAEVETTYDVGDISALAPLLAASRDVTVSDASVAALRHAFTWEERAEDMLALYKRAAAGGTAADLTGKHR